MGNDDAKAAAKRAKELRKAGKSFWVGSGKRRQPAGKGEARMRTNRKRAEGKPPVTPDETPDDKT